MLNKYDLRINNSKTIFVNLILIVALLILRIIILNAALFRTVVPPVSTILYYEISTYFVILVFICINQKELTNFHIDRLSLIFLILFSTILRIDTYDIQPIGLVRLAYWMISLGVLILLVRNWSKLKNTKPIWIGIAVVIGIALPVLTYIMRFIRSNVIAQHPLPRYEIVLGSFLGFLLVEIGQAAIYEEIVFRGFFWGFLRSRGINEILIWLVQAFIFSLAHLYVIIQYPISGLFFVILGLTLGWLAWQSRSVAPSIIAHGVYNALILSIRYFFAI